MTKIGNRRAVLPMLMLVAFFSSVAALAQEARVRITESIDNNVLVRLAGTHHPLVSAVNDIGRVSGDMAMERMVLVLKPADEQAVALTRLINQQHDKQSAGYHSWLTPEQYGAQFGLAESDLQQITGWLQQQGFRVDAVSRGRQWIEFSGTAAQVENAFHTEMHHYMVKGEHHLANASDISLPHGLAPVVAGVLSLHDFRKKAAHSKAFQLQRDPATGNMARVAELVPSQKGVSAAAAAPTFTLDSSTHFLTPGDYARIYNTLPLLNAGVNGTDVSIAIVGRTDINLSDVQAFRQIFGLPANDPTFIVNGADPGVNGDELESDLDVEWSGAAAPNAAIKFVTTLSTFTTDGVDLSASYIVDNRVAPIMSISYGQCEAFLGPAGNAFHNSLYQQAAAEGITVFVSTGDNGPAGCDAPEGFTPAQNGLNVSGLASTPYNVAVGGTEFKENGADSTYWLSENRSDLSSAIGYIPEAVWNESCDPTVDPNHCGGTYYYLLWSGSGGSSSCTDSTISGNLITCISGYPKPSWQAGHGVLADGTRDLPDVALAAAGGHDGYLVCIEGSCQWTVQNGQTVLMNAAVVGGTSASTPSMAGIMALVEQKNGAYQGLANYGLYQLAAGEKLSLCNSSKLTDPNASSTCVFYDVTAGNNNVPGQIGFNAGWAYDRASGLGSVNAANLVNGWNSAKKLGSATTLSGAATSLQHGTPLPLNVLVQPAAGTGSPSGDFSLLSSHGSVFGGTLTNGAFSGGVNGFDGGTYSIKAHYAGDAMFGASDSSPISIKVTPEPSTVSSSIWVVNLAGFIVPYYGTLNYGQPVAVQFNVAGKSGVGSATGTATIVLDDSVKLGTFPLNQSGSGWAQIDNILHTGLVPGTHTVKVLYGGDNSFGPSFSKQLGIEIRKGFPRAYGAPFPGSIIVGSTVRVNFVVGVDGTLPATGTVDVYDNGKRIASDLPLAQNGLFGTGLAQLNYTFSGLKEGFHALQISYSGDANYQPLGTQVFDNRPADVMVNAATGVADQVLLTQSRGTVTLGDSVQYSVMVKPAKSSGPIPTGTVTLVGENGGPFAKPVNLVNGAATITLNWTFTNKNGIVAAFSGDSNYTAQNSNFIVTVVNPATPTVTLSAAANQVAAGTATSLTVSTIGKPWNTALSVPYGEVVFFDSVDGGVARRIGSGFLTTGNGGNPIFTLPVTLPKGHNLIHVRYMGTYDWEAADSNGVHVTVE